EGGKQEYERKNIEYQKRWEALSSEEKLVEVKKEYRHGENITEIAARSEIPPMPTGNDNNFSSSASENGSKSNERQGKDEDNSKNYQKQDHSQSEKNLLGINSTGLIIGGIVVISFALFATFLFTEKEKQDLEKYKIREVEHPNNNIMFSFSRGSGACFRKECIGHHPQQLGVFCSKDCHDEQLGGANLEEKDIYRDESKKFRKWLREKYGEEEFACDKMAAPGEKYCFYCEHERSGEK
ncbi:5530_t:CDS:2, partial [Ambispora leptoticha]